MAKSNSGGAFSMGNRNIYNMQRKTPQYIYVQRQESYKGGNRRLDH